MANLNNLLIGMFFGALAQISTFYQLQGSLKFEILKNNYWLTVLMGIPISMLFLYSVKNLIIAFDGQLWPSRLIGFSIGAMVFSWLSWVVFNEPLTIKTIICLILSVAILLIQLFVK
jgi:multidrug transporter EmrE-like cation transporter